MPAAFYPCSIAFYVGLLFLALDLAFLEKWSTGVKSVFILIIVAGGIIYREKVILHPNPISFSYRTEGTTTVLSIRNESGDDDYQDVDVRVFVDRDAKNLVYIDNLAFRNNPGQCYFSGIDPYELAHGQGALYQAEPDKNSYRVSPNSFRVICAKLPNESHVSIVIQLIRPTVVNGKITQPNSPVLPPEDPRFQCKFTGRFRSVNIQSAFERQK